QSRWTAALKAAQRAIDLEDEYSEGYYQLACALTRLGRTKEALAALAKAVELDPDQVDYMIDEKDLKALSRLPGFKKFMRAPDKKEHLVGFFLRRRRAIVEFFHQNEQE